MALLAMLVCAGGTGYGIVAPQPVLAFAALLSAVTITFLTVIRLARVAAALSDPHDHLAPDQPAQSRLEDENQLLRAMNADLRAVHAAIARGFDLVDDLTAGELRVLVERAGGDLVSLVDEGVEADAGRHV